MATPSAAILCSLLALLVWAPVGWLIARRLPLDRDMRLAASPVLGWAVQNVVALQGAAIGGFTPANILAATAFVGLAAILLPAPDAEEKSILPLPWWVFAVAAAVAVGPACGVLPKIYPDGIALADPIYDHAKIALVDEMVRTGVPPANPFLGTADGGPGHILYYYYWLFGAAQLARVSGASGWEADTAVTWFTAFASLSLMCGVAWRLSGGRTASVLFVSVAACGGSFRPVLAGLFGQGRVDAVLEHPSGLAGWFFQVSWSPHHVASATVAVLSIILMERLARAPSAAATLVLGLLVAAGFGSSLWVGGITFVLCASAAGAVLLFAAKPGRRLPFLAALTAAGCVAIALAFPLLAAQFYAAAERGGGAIPITVSPFPVLGPVLAAGARGWLDIVAYWLVLLPIEFPAAWILGVVAAFRLKSALTPVLAAAAFASLSAGWMLVSTVGENNDLGWRAVLPGLMILTPLAGAYVARSLAQRRVMAAIASVVLLGLAMPDGLGLLRHNIAGHLSGDGARFRDAPALWAAVRRHTAPEERIASNPQLMSSLTAWPISLSWALLADRRSCFAGNELALAFTTLPPAERDRAGDLFDRVFGGSGSEADLTALVRDFDCAVIVLTPRDGAWNRDPFAASTRFNLVEEADDAWRIYRVIPSIRSQPSPRRT